MPDSLLGTDIQQLNKADKIPVFVRETILKLKYTETKIVQTIG